jgi:MoaA/NifB/PqqE/SkfB family radical SAM enzyme
MKKDKNDKYARTVIRLLTNAIRFRRARLKTAPLKPEVVSLALTIRCNSHCVMCNMWRQASKTPGIADSELTREEIIELLSKPLFSGLVELDLTGGEPHLRDDLVDIVLNIAALKKDRFPRLKSIVITSNGLLFERIITNYRAILGGIKDTGIDLVSVASLDGIGEVHDRIRGTKGAYRLAMQTLQGLSELKKEYSSYYVGVKTTVLPQNVDSLDSILEYARERGFFHIISPVFFTEARFRNSNKRESLELSPADRAKLLRFYRNDELDTSYFYTRIRDYLASGEKSWSCTAAYNYLFIDFDGMVYPCELLSESIGNVREKAIEDIWKSEVAKEWRDKIDRIEMCRACIEPGAVRYSACAEGLSYLGFLRDLGRKRYLDSLSAEGFIKYMQE